MSKALRFSYGQVNQQPPKVSPNKYNYRQVIERIQTQHAHHLNQEVEDEPEHYEHSRLVRTDKGLGKNLHLARLSTQGNSNRYEPRKSPAKVEDPFHGFSPRLFEHRLNQTTHLASAQRQRSKHQFQAKIDEYFKQNMVREEQLTRSRVRSRSKEARAQSTQKMWAERTQKLQHSITLFRQHMKNTELQVRALPPKVTPYIKKKHPQVYQVDMGPSAEKSLQAQKGKKNNTPYLYQLKCYKDKKAQASRGQPRTRDYTWMG